MLAEIVWNQQTVGIVMTMSVPIVAILAGTWMQVEKTRSRNDLKRSMIERGMSIDEMQRVLDMRVKR